ncbi:MAG: hypothetical protein COB90_09905 [Hyphomicrobiales bacterium]|nr:MAG: hypothetical protein COB90_09905 [Hyphomicrobiales bacterium]
MANVIVPHYKNDVGVKQISIGAKEFQCVGASPPQDHPHIYLDMGADTEIICPYCSTLYKFEDNLGVMETSPANCAHLVDNTLE